MQQLLLPPAAGAMCRGMASGPLLHFLFVTPIHLSYLHSLTLHVYTHSPCRKLCALVRVCFGDCLAFGWLTVWSFLVAHATWWFLPLFALLLARAGCRLTHVLPCCCAVPHGISFFFPFFLAFPYGGALSHGDAPCCWLVLLLRPGDLVAGGGLIFPVWVGVPLLVLSQMVTLCLLWQF